MRFRYSGPGWECARGVIAIGRQIETIWVDRHPADGTRASATHAQYPRSDHGPDPSGIVRAIDIGVDRPQGQLLAEQLRKGRDDRLAYAIHDRRILRSYPKGSIPSWTWAPYGGTNPHTGHVHVSTVRNPDLDRDGSAWDLDIGGDMYLTIEQLQRALVDAGHDLGTFGPDGDGIDGDYGAKTHAAFVAALREGTLTVPDEVLRANETVRLVRRRP